MIITPFGNHILVAPEKKKGVILTQKEQFSQRGTVLKIGDACTRIKEGDTILFTGWGVDTVQIDGEELCFLSENDEFILATIKV